MTQPKAEIKVEHVSSDRTSADVQVAVRLIKGGTPCPTMKMRLNDGSSLWEITGYGMVPVEALNCDPPKLILSFKKIDESDEWLSAGDCLVEV